MTSDMAFECLLVSQDAAVVGMMNRLLGDLSISTNICLTPADALGLVNGRSVDLLVLDFPEDARCEDLLCKLSSFVKTQKTTVLAITSGDKSVQNAHLVLRKPFWVDSAEKHLRTAYHKMLQDHRKKSRVAVMSSVVATDQHGKSFPVLVTDVGHGGVGLSTKETLAIGNVLSFCLPLPDAQKSLDLQIRVLWTRDYGAAGGEYKQIRPADLAALHEWLDRKSQVKKPLRLA